jgi:predicted nucleotidyltransferase
MVSVIDDKRDSIIAICRKYGVAELYVFGSALTEEFDPARSDIDFLVEFGSMDGHAKAHAYFDMLDELRELLDADVDLVMVGAVKNRYVAADIERTKQVLYAA